MEWKIGEIRQVNGEWYQCVEQPEKIDYTVCTLCDFHSVGNCELDRCRGTYRSDKKNVIFKKLEKVGESYSKYVFPRGNVLVQRYKLHIPCDTNVSNGYWIYHWNEKLVDIEIKQAKEDMEEKKLNLKPFDIQKARAGKPVCTRDGRKARIICFDAKDTQPIIGLYEKNIDGIVREYLCSYHTDGRMYDDQDTGYDLMMLTEKKEGWVNIDKGGSGKITVSSPYSTKEEAIHNDNETTIDTIKISWEE